MDRKIQSLRIARMTLGVLVCLPLLALVPEKTPAEQTAVSNSVTVPAPSAVAVPSSAGMEPGVAGDLDMNLAVLTTRLARIAPGPMHTCGLSPELANRVACLAGMLEPKSAAARRAEAPKFIPPVYGVITSGYGYRKPPLGKSRQSKPVMHEGVDLAAPKNALFVAPAPGKVVAVEHKKGYGALLTIEHAAGFETRYAHVGSVFVKAGETVRSGQPLGVVGMSGRTTGPHIHFEMRREGKLIDPAPYLDLPTEKQLVQLSRR
jgi:murein DD-endopeptidase MepM/ murein hydrolase activator NlpD